MGMSEQQYDTTDINLFVNVFEFAKDIICESKTLALRYIETHTRLADIAERDMPLTMLLPA